MNDDADQLTREAQATWDANATFWNRVLGETGNRFHQTIVEPSVLHLLDLQPGEHILDVGCGNGAFARTLSQRGANVVASDFSAGLLDHARSYPAEHNQHIEYVLIDATQEAQLLALGMQRFDAVVSTMALMDMATITPLFTAVSKLLKPGGRFVFAMQHPVFNSNGAAKTVEMDDRDGELITRHAIKVWRYRTPWVERATGIVGQERPHPIFHRPLHVLFNTGFEAGFVLDGLEEPEDTAPANENKWWAWSNYKETPPALVARMKLK